MISKMHITNVDWRIMLPFTEITMDRYIDHTDANDWGAAG